MYEKSIPRRGKERKEEEEGRRKEGLRRAGQRLDEEGGGGQGWRGGEDGRNGEKRGDAKKLPRRQHKGALEVPLCYIQVHAPNYTSAKVSRAPLSHT